MARAGSDGGTAGPDPAQQAGLPPIGPPVDPLIGLRANTDGRPAAWPGVKCRVKAERRYDSPLLFAASGVMPGTTHTLLAATRSDLGPCRALSLYSRSFRWH